MYIHTCIPTYIHNLKDGCYPVPSVSERRKPQGAEERQEDAGNLWTLNSLSSCCVNFDYVFLFYKQYLKRFLSKQTMCCF